MHQYFSFEDISEEDEVVFDKSNPAYLEIRKQAKLNLTDCSRQLGEELSIGDTTIVLESLHKLIPILHLLGNNELKDEVLISDALLSTNPDLNTYKIKLQLLQDKLDSFGKSL